MNFISAVPQLLEKVHLHHTQSSKLLDHSIEAILNHPLYRTYYNVPFGSISPDQLKEQIMDLLSSGEMKGLLDLWQVQKKHLSPQLYQRACEMALTYLPSQEYGFPDVYPALYPQEYDWALGYDTVLLNLSSIHVWGDKLLYILAHEFHHHCKNQIIELNYDHIYPQDEGPVNFINIIAIEGIAELISHPGLPRENPQSLIPLYRQKIQGLDRRKLNKSFLNFIDFMDYHQGPAVWLHMAQELQEAKGVEWLKQCVRNPFQFIRGYNSLPSPLLDFKRFQSDFDRLEKKYIKGNI